MDEIPLSEEKCPRCHQVYMWISPKIEQRPFDRWEDGYALTCTWHCDNCHLTLGIGGYVDQDFRARREDTEGVDGNG